MSKPNGDAGRDNILRRYEEETLRRARLEKGRHSYLGNSGIISFL